MQHPWSTVRSYIGLFLQTATRNLKQPSCSPLSRLPWFTFQCKNFAQIPSMEESRCRTKIDKEIKNRAILFASSMEDLCKQIGHLNAASKVDRLLMKKILWNATDRLAFDKSCAGAALDLSKLTHIAKMECPVATAHSNRNRVFAQSSPTKTISSSKRLRFSLGVSEAKSCSHCSKKASCSHFLHKSTKPASITDAVRLLIGMHTLCKFWLTQPELIQFRLTIQQLESAFAIVKQLQGYTKLSSAGLKNSWISSKYTQRNDKPNERLRKWLVAKEAKELNMPEWMCKTMRPTTSNKMNHRQRKVILQWESLRDVTSKKARMENDLFWTPEGDSDENGKAFEKKRKEEKGLQLNIGQDDKMGSSVVTSDQERASSAPLSRFIYYGKRSGKKVVELNYMYGAAVKGIYKEAGSEPYIDISEYWDFRLQNLSCHDSTDLKNDDGSFDISTPKGGYSMISLTDRALPQNEFLFPASFPLQELKVVEQKQLDTKKLWAYIPVIEQLWKNAKLLDDVKFMLCKPIESSEKEQLVRAKAEDARCDRVLSISGIHQNELRGRIHEPTDLQKKAILEFPKIGATTSNTKRLVLDEAVAAIKLERQKVDGAADLENYEPERTDFAAKESLSTPPDPKVFSRRMRTSSRLGFRQKLKEALEEPDGEDEEFMFWQNAQIKKDVKEQGVACDLQPQLDEIKGKDVRLRSPATDVQNSAYPTKEATEKSLNISTTYSKRDRLHREDIWLLQQEFDAAGSASSAKDFQDTDSTLLHREDLDGQSTYASSLGIVQDSTNRLARAISAGNNESSLSKRDFRSAYENEEPYIRTVDSSVLQKEKGFIAGEMEAWKQDETFIISKHLQFPKFVDKVKNAQEVQRRALKLHESDFSTASPKNNQLFYEKLSNLTCFLKATETDTKSPKDNSKIEKQHSWDNKAGGIISSGRSDRTFELRNTTPQSIMACEKKMSRLVPLANEVVVEKSGKSCGFSKNGTFQRKVKFEEDEEIKLVKDIEVTR